MTQLTKPMAPLILASGSPRRKHWLEVLRLPFEVRVPHVDESPHPGEEPWELVERLSIAKAQAVKRIFPERWILASDTTVAVDHLTLNKPTDSEDAVRMVRLIQGRAHQVHTGLCLLRGEEVHAFVDTATVHFRPISLAQARWYVETGEPMDKAGSYAAQGIAAMFIERIEGSFSTVMGLPVERLGELLQRLGLLEAWLGLPMH